MKHIVKIEIDNKIYGIPEEVFNYIRQCCNKINEIEEENKQLKEQLEYLRSNEYLNQVKWERDFNEDLVKELQQRIKNCEAYLISINDFDFNYKIPNAILDNDEKIIKEYIEQQTKAYRNYYGKDYEKILMRNSEIRCLINLGYLEGEEND